MTVAQARGLCSQVAHSIGQCFPESQTTGASCSQEAHNHGQDSPQS